MYTVHIRTSELHNRMVVTRLSKVYPQVHECVCLAVVDSDTLCTNPWKTFLACQCKSALGHRQLCLVHEMQ